MDVRTNCVIPTVARMYVYFKSGGRLLQRTFVGRLARAQADGAGRPMSSARG